MRISHVMTTLAISFSIAGIAEAREQLSLAGSSTVLPFATIIAEEMGKNPSFKTPVVESGGSSVGKKEFVTELELNTSISGMLHHE